MKTICYIIPYFGKLPKNFALYLLSCAQNPTVNWKILTDDRTPYEFPTNVHVKYCNYEEVKQRIKAWFDFETVAIIALQAGIWRNFRRRTFRI